MQLNPVNKQFLEDYYDILPHHINSILKSGMILDEDMNLLLTFWNPNLNQSFTNIKPQSMLVSGSFATAGVVTSMKFHNIYPLIICMIPATVQLIKRSISYYWKEQYKKTFERFLFLIRSIYNLNREIIQYYNKRDHAVQNQKLQLDAFYILMKPGLNFLKYAISVLHEIVSKMKSSMLNICKLVPITEADFISSIQWNLEEMNVFDESSFNEMKLQFEKLSDLYLLITSNFLSSVGLSFCIQLWKEPCDFQKVFNDLIPSLVRFLDKSINDLESNFNTIRYNLCSNTAIQKENKIVKISNHLKQPIADLLVSLQITFESTKYLQVLVENSYGNDEDCLAILNDINSQLENSRDALNILINRGRILMKKQTKENKDVEVELSGFTISDDKFTDTVIGNTEDDIIELEDEEYHLSIHGSESDYVDCNDTSTDYHSAENFNVVMLELKKTLLQREGKVGKQAQEENKQNDEDRLPSPEKVPLRLPVVPDFGDINGLMQAVTFTAQKLNRSEEFQFGFNMFPEIPRPFNTTYRCFSVAMLPGNERQDVERGGKIIMPPSALEQLTRLNINYPMQFKIVNKNTNRTSHCGVLEFVADEGKVYLPLWMMHNLVLEEGDLIQIESVSLPVGTFAKFQPLSPEFLDITNPKAVLENCLRTFSCLTSGDVIAVKYNQRVYELCVLETQPGKAISIIECDMNVEFAAPVGYKETEEVKQPEEGMVVDPADLMPEPAGFVAFRGTGNRLDGKRRKDSGTIDGVSPKPVYIRGIPDYDYRIGTLKFLRPTPKSATDDKEENGEFKAFSGEGFSLRQRN